MNPAPAIGADPPPMAETTLALDDVSVTLGDRVVLDHISWQVRSDERWVVLGRNGSGKTTLVRVASLLLHPSDGTVDVLGERLGRTDVRSLRTRIGLASSAMADKLRPGISAIDAVMTARHAALEPWWHTYDDTDQARALELLGQLGIASLGHQRFGSLSSGERQRVLLARALMNDPGLLLLDEPTAGLDLAGREDLVSALDDLAALPGSPPMVLVTHHVEEIPTRFTHVLLLLDGQILAAGPIETTFDATRLSACFGLELHLGRTDSRWSARSPTRDRE